MKKALFIFMGLYMSSSIFSQNLVNDDNPSKLRYAKLDTMAVEYVHAILAENGKNYIVGIDAGEGYQWTIATEKNTLKAFRSPAQLFNFMYNNQWEYIDTIAEVSSSGAATQIFLGFNKTKTDLVYVFKRRKN